MHSWPVTNKFFSPLDRAYQVQLIDIWDMSRYNMEGKISDLE